MSRIPNITPSFLLAAILLPIVLCSVIAHAQQTVEGEVLVVLASEEKGQIDPALVKVPALRRPPFDSFKSMQVMTRTDVVLRLGESITVSLPNGRRLQLKLKKLMPDGRSKVQVSINRPNQKDYLPLLEVIASVGEPFFVAGQKYKGGTLVIGVRVGKRPDSAPAKSQKNATRSP